MAAVKVATQDEVAADFAGLVKASKAGPVVVTSEGQPVAVLLGAKDEDDLERLLLGHSPKLQAILEAARKRFKKGRGFLHDELWKGVEAESVHERQKRSRKQKNGRTKS